MHTNTRTHTHTHTHTRAHTHTHTHTVTITMYIVILGYKRFAHTNQTLVCSPCCASLPSGPWISLSPKAGWAGPTAAWNEHTNGMFQHSPIYGTWAGTDIQTLLKYIVYCNYGTWDRKIKPFLQTTARIISRYPRCHPRMSHRQLANLVLSSADVIHIGD